MAALPFQGTGRGAGGREATVRLAHTRALPTCKLTPMHPCEALAITAVWKTANTRLGPSSLPGWIQFSGRPTSQSHTV